MSKVIATTVQSVIDRIDLSISQKMVCLHLMKVSTWDISVLTGKSYQHARNVLTTFCKKNGLEYSTNSVKRTGGFNIQSLSELVGNPELVTEFNARKVQ
jgi:hypothetical protein